MRRAYGPEYGINENGFWAINLGADFCAEHEYGISKISEAFGIGKKDTVEPIFGIDKRTITECPETLHFVKFRKNNKGCAMLIYAKYLTDVSDVKQLSRNISLYGDETLATGWCESDFGILTTGKENIERLKELYDAFKCLDVAIWLGGGHAFKKGGIIIAIVSKVSESLIETLQEADEDYHKLQEAARNTGIVEKLKDANKRYFALKPSWANEEKTSVEFWLNPMEQHHYNSGWYTVSDLEEWIAGTGKIIKAQLYVSNANKKT